MKASRLVTMMLAGLLTAFVATDIAEAKRPHPTVERRLRPGRGYWQAAPKTTARTYQSPTVQMRQQPRQVQGPVSPYRNVQTQRRFGWRLFNFR